MKVYKVCSEGNWCAYKTLDDATEFLVGDIECEVDEMEKGDQTRSYYLEVDEMSEEDFNDLPEFDGF